MCTCGCTAPGHVPFAPSTLCFPGPVLQVWLAEVGKAMLVAMAKVLRSTLLHAPALPAQCSRPCTPIVECRIAISCGEYGDNRHRIQAWDTGMAGRLPAHRVLTGHAHGVITASHAGPRIEWLSVADAAYGCAAGDRGSFVVGDHTMCMWQVTTEALAAYERVPREKWILDWPGQACRGTAGQGGEALGHALVVQYRSSAASIKGVEPERGVAGGAQCEPVLLDGRGGSSSGESGCSG